MNRFMITDMNGPSCHLYAAWEPMRVHNNHMLITSIILVIYRIYWLVVLPLPYLAFADHQCCPLCELRVWAFFSCSFHRSRWGRIVCILFSVLWLIFSCIHILVLSFFTRTASYAIGQIFNFIFETSISHAWLSTCCTKVKPRMAH